MKRIIFLVLALLGLGNLHAQTDCSHAIPVETTGVNNASFSTESTPPSLICTGGETSQTMGIWYTYSTSEVTYVTITTEINDYPIKDTRVHVYSGNCESYTCVAGDDDSGEGLSSTVSFLAQPDENYIIVFDNRWDSDDFVFEVMETTNIPLVFTSDNVDITGGYIMCVADMNGDYLDDIVVPADGSIKILYQNTDGTFTETTATADYTPYMPGWSLAAGDYDGNGYNDLLYGNGNGATLMIANDDGTAYSAMLSPESIFSQRTNFVDLDNDGNLDAFVCHDVAPNVYFQNDGEGSFSYHQGGIGDHPNGGNYGSIWVDYDNDGDVDLFIAKCRGGGSSAGINELHRNDGDGVFTDVSEEANMNDIIQTWSTAMGDFDNDGDMDAFVGANSTSEGSHKLMANNNDGTFSDITASSGVSEFTELSREHVTHDFDNDGWLDVLGGGSYILFNNGDMTFTPTSVPNISSGPIGDLNNDGFLDVLNGGNIKINGGNDNNWIKIYLEGTESNRNGIGARVELYATGEGWTKQIRDVRSGDGFRFMSSLNTHFGLGQTEEIDQIVIKWPSGIIDVIENPNINEPLMVVEGETLSKTNFNNSTFIVYPNPVKNIIQFTGKENTVITDAFIYSISGKLVSSGKVSGTSVPVNNLANGTYILIVKDDNGKHYSTKFIKE